MNPIRRTLVCSLLTLLVLVPATPARTVPLVRETVRLAEQPFLRQACGSPTQIHIIGASKLRTVLVAARRVLQHVVDGVHCKQVLPLSIRLWWVSVIGAAHGSAAWTQVGTAGTTHPRARAAP